MRSIREYNSQEYRPALDGLRCFAVASAILFHAWIECFPGGWIGVHVFFVISGYLITSLLKAEISTYGTISFGNFYMRRVLRLAPAYIAVLIFTTLLVLLFSSTKVENLKAILVAALYLSNIARASDLLPHTGYLAHTWSLSMEEQFYMLWPVMLILIVYKKPIYWVASGIALITLWRLHLLSVGAGVERITNGPDTMADSLLFGCALAFIPAGHRIKIFRMSLLIVPVAAMLLMIAVLDYRTIFSQAFGTTLVSLASAWLIVGCLQPGWLQRFLSLPPIVYTGRISYGWYLWHYPLLAAASIFLHKTGMPKYSYGSIAVVASILALSYVSAMMSFQYLERPFLRLKSRYKPDRQSRRQHAFDRIEESRV